VAKHKWHFVPSKNARSQIWNLPYKQRLLIFKCLQALLESDNPKALTEVKKLVDVEGDIWRARQGDYRIIFTIDSSPLKHDKHEYAGTIEILAVLHRSEAYKK
jgi:mRNA-degrading endonuclease RelE of RelBE toxin-antitoxin system